MYVDASALVAILLREPNGSNFVDALARARGEEIITSPIAIYEATAAVARSLRCTVTAARASVDDLLHESAITIVPIAAHHGEIAIAAFEQFGKGKHPAALNMGDCFGYAVARAARTSILFKGDDFSRTDLANALGD